MPQKNRSILIIFLCIRYLSFSQSINDYRSAGNGNWTITANWEVYNGTAWVAAANYPGQVAGANDVTILGGNIIVLNSNIPNAINSLTVGNDDGTLDFLEIAGTSSIQTNLVTIKSDGRISWTQNVTFTLPPDVVLIIESGGALQSGRPGCSNSQILALGTTRYATCRGAGPGPLSFDQLNNNGGNLFIIGKVFEDPNYPGGVGRNLTISNGVGVANATVELYGGASTLTTSTDSDGDYFFGGLSNGTTYSVRVINTTVRSTRGGGTACGTCIPVQTFRRSFSSNTFTDITTEIGGADPAGQETGAGSLTNAQSVSQVVINSSGANGVDFGFNFNTIVNTNEDGQGSLDQFIINANNLDETGLDIEANSIFDPAAGEDTSIFNIPTADTGYNATEGYFNIFITNELNTITDNFTSIDGRTQTSLTGDTNTGAVGSGGTPVGVSATILPAFNQPEIQVQGDSGSAYGFNINASNSTIRNLAIYGNSDGYAGIEIDAGSNNLITENLIGADANGALVSNLKFGIEINGGASIISANYLANSDEGGVSITNSTAVVIQRNHFEDNGRSECKDGIEIQGGSGIVIQNNLVENSGEYGINNGNSNAVTIAQNTVTGTGNGICLSDNPAGIRLLTSNNSVTGNIINANGETGIFITGGGSGNLISLNSIFANGTNNTGLGIDFFQDGLTKNDPGDSNAAPNFPIIESATIAGTTLTIKGWARPNSIIEVFLTDINQGTAFAGDNSLGSPTALDYGEGQLYLGSGTEGSTGDSDETSSAYNIDGNTDTTERFNLDILLGATIPVGSLVTTTATIPVIGTSEFSFGFAVTAPRRTVITNRNVTYRVKRN